MIGKTDKHDHWISRANDSDLQELFNGKDQLYAVPDELEQKVFNIIENDALFYQNNAEEDEVKKPFFSFITKPAFAFAVGFAVLLIIPSTLYLTGILKFGSAQSMIVTIESVEGDATIGDNGETRSVHKGKGIDFGQILETGRGALTRIKVSESSHIELMEETQLAFVNFEQSDDDESSSFYLSAGEINCDVTLPTGDSQFKVLTDLAAFSVIGTRFKLRVQESGDNALTVDEGKVRIANFIKSSSDYNSIPGSYPILHELIEGLVKMSEDFTVGKDVTISNKKLAGINNDLTRIVDAINNKIEGNEILSSRERGGYIEGLVELQERARGMFYETSMIREKIAFEAKNSSLEKSSDEKNVEIKNNEAKDEVKKEEPDSQKTDKTQANEIQTIVENKTDVAQKNENISKSDDVKPRESLIEEVVEEAEIVTETEIVHDIKEEIVEVSDPSVNESAENPVKDSIVENEQNTPVKDEINFTAEIVNKESDNDEESTGLVSARIGQDEPAEKNENEVVVEAEKDDIAIPIVVKLPGTSGISVSDVNTAVTADKTNIFVMNSNNKQIHCFDSRSGSLVWTFEDKKITNITSALMAYDNKLVFGTPEYIYILKNDGSLERTYSIDNGPSFWADPIVAEDNLFIPAFNQVYKYDGSNFEVFETRATLYGQVFMTYDHGNIYLNDLVSKKISAYSMAEQRIIWETTRLNDRSFMEPVTVGSTLYTIDMKGVVYTIDRYSGKFRTFETGVPVMTNIVYSKKTDSFYFVSNNGYFYKYSDAAGGSVEKISSVDEFADKNAYLTKKLVIHNDAVYFNSNTGQLFMYDLQQEKAVMVPVKGNSQKLALIGSPVTIENELYFMDSALNIYKMLAK